MTEQRRSRRFVLAMPTRVRLRFWAILALVGFVFAYWVLAWNVQAIDLDHRMPVVWNRIIFEFPLLDTFTPLVAFTIEMFWPFVLRHLIPLGAGVILGNYVVIDLVQHLYNLSDRAAARRLLGRFTGGRAKPLALNRPNFAEQRLQHSLLHIGGPGFVNVAASDVIVTEINGRFERVLGAGRQKLKRFEYIRSILDLREQKRFNNDVVLFTREGLNVHTSVEIVFRLQRSQPGPEHAHLYTFQADSIQKAAYAQTVSDHGIGRWDGAPLPIAMGQLRKLVSRMRLDELIEPKQVFDNRPHPELQNQVEGKTRQILQNIGVELISVGIGALRFDQEVQETLLDYWKAFSEKPKPIDANPQNAFTKDEMTKKMVREKVIQGLAQGLARMQEQGRMMRSSDTDQAMMRVLGLLAHNLQQQAPTQLPNNNAVSLPRDTVAQILRALQQQIPDQTGQR